MDGKLLVLCGERPTINSHGDPIDEKGNVISKENEKDSHKRVISGMNLINPIMTEVLEPDILFVDWETIVTSDIEPLQEMKRYAFSSEPIPPQMILDSDKNPSLMKRAHMERLLQLDKHKARPSIDYGFQAMDDFFEMFTEAVQKNGIVSILPAFPLNDQEEINRARFRVLKTWADRNSMNSINNREEKIEVLPAIDYISFGDVYDRAQMEMLNILSKPDWYEKGIVDEEPGGRD